VTQTSKQHQPVKLRSRRLLGIALTIVAVLAFWIFVSLQRQSLQHTAWSTGYSLFGCLLFLAAFNLRKKLAFLPVPGTCAMWMQLHIYVAFFSIAVFLMHIGFEVPNGVFEQGLAFLYVTVAGSGVYGLYMTRTIPRKLTATGFEVIFEQIPEKRRQLVACARNLILETARSTDVIAKFYLHHLAQFMERPRSFAYNLSPSLRTSKTLIEEIRHLDRYLSPPQRESSRKLSTLVREKEDLDYHWALQGRLKVWLFVHIGMTYGLLLVSVLHGVIAHSFGGGLR
jgi:hypothetical protein